MNNYTRMSEKVGMTVFNLKVKDLYRLVKLDKSDASDGCSTPALGVNDIKRVSALGMPSAPRKSRRIRLSAEMLKSVSPQPDSSQK